MTGLVAIGGAIIITLVCVILLLLSRNRYLKKTKDEAESAATAAVDRLEQTVDLHGRQQKIREDAREEKESLDESADSDLPDRANDLFG